MPWNRIPTRERTSHPAVQPFQICNDLVKLKPGRKNDCNTHLKAAKSGCSITLAGKPFQSSVVKYDHDLCMYSKLKDGSMRHVPEPLKL